MKKTLKKVLNKKPSKKQIIYAIVLVVVLGGFAYLYLGLRQAKKDVTTLWIAVDTLPGGSQALSGDYKEEFIVEDVEVTYKITNQYVEDVDVVDDDYNYKMEEDVRYVKKKLRVVEVEVVNNTEWLYSTYGNLGATDKNGKIIRPIQNIKEGQDKNYEMNRGYGFELAPGGKGVLYVYFEDNGSEITELFDIDNSRLITP